MRTQLAAHLNRLVSLGVSGFRVADAALMPAADLAAVLALVQTVRADVADAVGLSAGAAPTFVFDLWPRELFQSTQLQPSVDVMAAGLPAALTADTYLAAVAPQQDGDGGDDGGGGGGATLASVALVTDPAWALRAGDTWQCAQHATTAATTAAATADATAAATADATAATTAAATADATADAAADAATTTTAIAGCNATLEEDTRREAEDGGRGGTHAAWSIPTNVGAESVLRALNRAEMHAYATYACDAAAAADAASDDAVDDAVDTAGGVDGDSGGGGGCSFVVSPDFDPRANALAHVWMMASSFAPVAVFSSYSWARAFSATGGAPGRDLNAHTGPPRTADGGTARVDCDAYAAYFGARCLDEQIRRSALQISPPFPLSLSPICCSRVRAPCRSRADATPAYDDDGLRWNCEHREVSISAMPRWRLEVRGSTTLRHLTAPTEHAVAFGRGVERQGADRRHGWIYLARATNASGSGNSGAAAGGEGGGGGGGGGGGVGGAGSEGASGGVRRITFSTGLPAGDYCPVLLGAAACDDDDGDDGEGGPDVSSTASARLTVDWRGRLTVDAPLVGAIALHTGAAAGSKWPSWQVPQLATTGSCDGIRRLEAALLSR